MNEGTAIIDPNNHATVVTDFNPCAEGQGAMRSGHSPAIHTFAVCSAAAAETIWSPVDACDFGISAICGETC